MCHMRKNQREEEVDNSLSLNGTLQDSNISLATLAITGYFSVRKTQEPQLGPQSYFAEKTNDFESDDYNCKSLCCQHPRIVLRYDVVHLIYQIHTLKRDMTTTLLEKANSEEIISEYLQ